MIQIPAYSLSTILKAEARSKMLNLLIKLMQDWHWVSALKWSKYKDMGIEIEMRVLWPQR